MNTGENMPEPLVPVFEAGGATLYQGDCIDTMRRMPADSVHAIITDPPYALEFMGKEWDAFGTDTSNGYREKPRITKRVAADDGAVSAFAGSTGGGVNSYQAGRPFQAWCTEWATEALRVLKPGGHLIAFGAPRTYHRLTTGVEDAGFEIRDGIAWLYGSGFPKSMDVSKAIAKKFDDPADFEAWEGWGTALKPGFEPAMVARKPLIGTIVANVVEHGTGALNIDATRTAFRSEADRKEATTKNQHASFGTESGGNKVYGDYSMVEVKDYDSSKGRWPTNVLLDESQAIALDEQTGVSRSRIGRPREGASGAGWGLTKSGAEYDDIGGASRFFPTFRYVAKAASDERPKVNGIEHPTVKPLELMRWLVRLLVPTDGVVLDPFAGSGTTLEAALIEGVGCIGIEREPDYVPLITARITKPLQTSMFGGWEGDAA